MNNAAASEIITVIDHYLLFIKKGANRRLSIIYRQPFFYSCTAEVVCLPWIRPLFMSPSY